MNKIEKYIDYIVNDLINGTKIINNKLSVPFSNSEFYKVKYYNNIEFKKYVENTSTTGNEFRWYQKTAGVLTATDPSKLNNIGFGSEFTNSIHRNQGDDI